MTHYSVLDNGRPRELRGNGVKRKRPTLVPDSEMTETGEIKWFDGDRKYGFVLPDNGGQDVFLHCSVLAQYGVRSVDLFRGAPVKFKSQRTPNRGLEVIAIALA
jgi:CspA family cold shock protein